MGKVTIDGIAMIPRAECEDRRLYRIKSRNLLLGVFKAETGGFLGLRSKFGSIYVFEEYHYENPEFATVAPQEALPEVLPVEIPLKEGLGTECQTCGVLVSYVKFPEGEREVVLKTGGTMMAPGNWEHLAPTDCKEPKAVGVYNHALDAWLHEMEKKYLPSV